MIWRPRELLTEAQRNLSPHPIGAGLVITALLTVFGVLTFGQSRAALEQEWSRQESGGLVWSAVGSPGVPLDGAICESNRSTTTVASKRSAD